jgi:hypothetical protein
MRVEEKKDTPQAKDLIQNLDKGKESNIPEWGMNVRKAE